MRHLLADAAESFDKLADMLRVAAYRPEPTDQAYGWAVGVTGGDGGEIIRVNTLSDFAVRSAIESANRTTAPTTICFDVTGILYLESQLDITGENITIDGTGPTFAAQRIFVNGARNVIIKNLRHRLGSAGSRTDCLQVWKSSDVLIDHCSFGWSRDELVSASLSRNVTIQHCIIGHPLHYEGHGLAAILGGDGIAAVGNLFAHCVYRPHIHGRIAIASNVFYNYSISDPIIVNPPQDSDPPTVVDLRGNTFVGGPSTQRKTPSAFRSIQSKALACSIHASENLVIPDIATPELVAEPVIRGPYTVAVLPHFNVRLPAAVISLQDMGAPIRDSLDERLIDEYLHGTGQLLHTENDIGGFPAL